MKSNRLWLVVGLVVVAAVVAYFLFAPKGNPDAYRVGAIVFLTGPQASLGTEVQNGLNVALEELNEKGGINGQKVEIIFEDSKDSPRDAILAFNRLETQNVPVVISTGDVVSLNLAPIATDKKIPVVATVAAGPDISKQSEWVFRVWIQATRQAQLIAEYAAKSLNVRSAAVLAINNEFGSATSSTFKQAFESNGGRVTGIETYGVADRDIRNQITKLKATNPQAIYITGFGEGYGAGVKQIRELQYAGLILSDATLAIPFFQQQTSPSNEGAYFTSTLYDENSQSGPSANFIKRYREKYNSTPGFVAAFSYDSFGLVAATIQKGGAAPQAIRDSLLAIRDYPGVIGTISFNPDRDADFPLLIKRIQNGKAITVSGEPQNANAAK